SRQSNEIIMYCTKKWSNSLFLEQLEDRLCPSAADPAIVFTFDALESNLAVMNADGSNQTTILSSSTRHFRTPAWSPDLNGNPLNGYQGTLAVSTYTTSINSDTQIWLVDVTV